jgi:hypothetical protein
MRIWPICCPQIGAGATALRPGSPRTAEGTKATHGDDRHFVRKKTCLSRFSEGDAAYRPVRDVAQIQFSKNIS